MWDLLVGWKKNQTISLPKRNSCKNWTPVSLQGPVVLHVVRVSRPLGHIEICMAPRIQINQTPTWKRRCQCGGRAKVFVFVWLLTHKVVRHKNKPDLRSRSTNALIQNLKKATKENSCSRPPSSGITVLQESTSPNSQVVRRGDGFCPTFKPGKYGQASTGTPSAESTTGGIRKRVSSWIQPHSHGRTRGHLKKGLELRRDP